MEFRFRRSLFVACCLAVQACLASETLLAFPPSLSLLPPNTKLPAVLDSWYSSSSREAGEQKIRSGIPLTATSWDNSLQLATAISCPSDVETLTSLLLHDLPSYANRVMQRSRRPNRTADSFSYVVVAGRPEFEPLTLGPGQYTPPSTGADPEPPQQIFFTTLERQYRGGKTSEIQLYHWLFLTQTTDGWRLAMMFSQIGSSAPERPPTPPRESSKGIVGQAVSLWLRDCRAGAIRGPRVPVRDRKT